VRLLDAKGIVVPDADVNVSFTLLPGSPAVILGTANGNPADHVRNTDIRRLTFHGLARCIVTSSAPGATGTITLVASATGAHGIAPATLSLVAK